MERTESLGSRAFGTSAARSCSCHSSHCISAIRAATSTSAAPCPQTLLALSIRRAPAPIASRAKDPCARPPRHGSRPTPPRAQGFVDLVRREYGDADKVRDGRSVPLAAGAAPRPPPRARKVHPAQGDARLVMLANANCYDVVDLDPYGSPATLLDAAVGGLS